MSANSGNAQSLRMTRRHDASPERVFDALVNPEMMRKWLFTEPETTFDIDLRVSGKWSLTNRRDSTDYTASGEYLEIDRARRLVYTFAILQFSPNSDTITIEIEPEGAGWVMTFMQSGVDIANELRQVPQGQKGGCEQGWDQGFDSLAAALR